MTPSRTFLAAFDLHGDRQDAPTVEKFFTFCKDWKPDIRIFGGDLWDLRSLRRKASEDERRDSMIRDFTMGMEFLHRFRPHYWTLGNHDYRLWDLAARDKGIESDYAMKCVGEVEEDARKMGCALYPYERRKGILRIGHLKVIHGFYAGMYAAKATALAYGSCLVGHTHTVEEFAVPGIERRVARCCGCLCSLDMDFQYKTVGSLRHAHGFSYGLIHGNGTYTVFQAEQIGGKWIVAEKVREL